jgi:hypothetical protein
MTKCWGFRRASVLASLGGIREKTECGAFAPEKLQGE